MNGLWKKITFASYKSIPEFHAREDILAFGGNITMKSIESPKRYSVQAVRVNKKLIVFSGNML